MEIRLKTTIKLDLSSDIYFAYCNTTKKASEKKSLWTLVLEINSYFAVFCWRMSHSISNHIYCANIYPYHNYQAGEYLGISVGEIEKGGNLSFPSQEVFNDRSLVNRVLKAPFGYNGTTITDLCLGRGWMEEEE